jgi:hypothetical protein
VATLREYFDTDTHRELTVHRTWLFGAPGEIQPEVIIAKIAYNFEANAKYWYFYVPVVSDLSDCLSTIFRSSEFSACRLAPEGDGVNVNVGYTDYSERLTAETLQFTKRIHLYLDYDLAITVRLSLVSEAIKLGYFLSIRDREYAKKRSMSEKPLAFISHDSRDKDPFVRGLVFELINNFCPVWYDEYSLKVGDSLRANIERGLKETRKCIVILSPNFLSNDGWGRAEFDSIYTREILEKENVMLPVWLDVDVNSVYNYSPRLADKVGLPASIGIPEIARQLANTIKAAPSK